MPKDNANYPYILCRDCGHPLSVIQQENLDGSYVTQVTCLRQNCLLYGFTLSIDHYMSLNHFQLESYRQVNRSRLPHYIDAEVNKTRFGEIR